MIQEYTECFYCILPLYYIYLKHLVTSYFADSDFSVIIDYDSLHVTNQTLCEWMLHQSQSSAFLNWLLYLQSNTKINHTNNPQNA